MWMLVFFAAMVVPFGALGLVMRKGKGAHLISGYNNLPQDVRDTVDERELCKSTGSMLLRMALVLALMGVATALRWYLLLFPLGSFLVVDGVLTTLSTHRKYPQMWKAQKEYAKPAIIVAICLLALAAILSGSMFFFGEKQPVARVQDGILTIKSGMYTNKIALQDITSVELLPTSVSAIGIKSRDGGYAGFGGTLRGTFSLQDGTRCQLYVDDKTYPTLHIRSANYRDIYINFPTAEETRAVYHALTGE